MPKTNYRQAKRNREETKKKRQIEKQQRKETRGTTPESDAAAAPKADAANGDALP